MELYKQTIAQLHGKLLDKKISSVELTQSVLERLKKTEPAIQAYLHVTEQQAISAAQRVDDKIAKGEKIAPLAGIPMSLKDLICTDGIRTTCASKMLENFVPPYDATIVTKLKDNDFVLLGKTNMDEFAMGSSTETSAFQKTYNPWDLSRVPGGSSGGSAASVAAGSAIYSIGSDTGGSIRQPASFNNIVGIKPTYGRVSRYGAIAYASSLDQLGPMTRSVEDAAIVLNAISGYDEKDSTSINQALPDYTKSLVNDIKGLKFGIPKEYFANGLDPKVADTIRKAISKIEEMGGKIVEISLPHTEYAVTTYYIISPAEASSNLARFDGVGYGYRSPNGKSLVEMSTNTRTEGFGEEVRRRILLGTYVLSSGYYDAYYVKAMKVRTLIKQDFKNAFDNVDLVLAPASPTVAYKIGDMVDPLSAYLLDAYTIPINLAGLPAISVPCGFVDGMPVGMQLIGKPLAEETLLRAAFAYEQNTNWHKQFVSLEVK